MILRMINNNDIISIIISILCAYIFSNLIFYFYIIKKTNNISKSQKMKLQTIGHRGSIQEGLPENTIASFKDAIEAGCNCIEFDVWLTKDNQVVIHHDDTVVRMTNTSTDKKIYEMNYNELPVIDINNNNKKYDRSHLYRKSDLELIPLLIDVLPIIPDYISIIIEFKQNSNELINEVQRILKAKNRNNNIFWFSLDENVNIKLRNTDPSIPTITSIIGMLKILLYYYLGILPFIDISDSVFGITVQAITLNDIKKEKSISFLPYWFKYILSILFQGKPPYFMIASKLFMHLRKRNIPIWFLGVNTIDDLLLAQKSGATAVLTDKIHWLINTMKDNDIEFKDIEN